LEKRSRLLSIGAIVSIKSFRLVDLAGDGELIREHVPKAEICKVLNPYYYKRNLKKMSKVLAQRLVRFFIKKVVDHILKGNRVLLPYGRSIYIGVMPVRDKAIESKRYLNLHTGGKIYGVKLGGIGDHNYHFKLKPARRQELKIRLLNGQEYYE
jgi:hypothetical protein